VCVYCNLACVKKNRVLLANDKNTKEEGSKRIKANISRTGIEPVTDGLLGDK